MGADLYSGKRYFRDSYNGWNLLWHFNLSWWQDIGPLLAEDESMSCENAQKLLNMLDWHEREFVDSLVEDPEKDYFYGKYEKFRTFLLEAIKKDEPIICSI